uniref:SH2_2 domain-containing protein n=1 Tax=Steinernema glaseri TaxID=37863 RepID=A0A1I8AQR4_9BILA
MDCVPFLFLEAVCAMLRKRDLIDLREIGTPWSWTATTQYNRTREFVVRISAEGTRVNIGSAVDLASLSKYDRIVDIQVKPVRYTIPADMMPLDEFRADVLPLLKPLAAHYPFDMNTFDMDAGTDPEQLTDKLQEPRPKEDESDSRLGHADHNGRTLPQGRSQWGYRSLWKAFGWQNEGAPQSTAFQRYPPTQRPSSAFFNRSQLVKLGHTMDWARPRNSLRFVL